MRRRSHRSTSGGLPRVQPHVNTGHPPADRFLRTLKAAGALPHILKYVKEEFRCETCEMKHGPDRRRRAQCARLFTFNRVFSVDVLYVKFQGVV